MNLSQFDRYAVFLIVASGLVALLTFSRFWNVDLPLTYGYVAQQDVIRPQFPSSVSEARSILWNFFGLINKMINPQTILPLKVFGLAFTLISFGILVKLLEYIFRQQFWGFLCFLLTALSPFSVVAAVSGGAAGIAAVLVILFVSALYKNEYVFAGLLSGAAVAANMPGVIMFLIAILDLLQNLEDRKKIVSLLLWCAGAFFGVVSLLFVYSKFSNYNLVLYAPISKLDLNWEFSGILPLLVVNILNLFGVVYLIIQRNYNFYRSHFPTLMLWLTLCALCIVQPSTLNLYSAEMISVILSMFFLQGFASSISLKSTLSGTLVFVVTAILLFSDLYVNDKFLKDVVLPESVTKEEVTDMVVESISSCDEGFELVSNFVPAELAVKLGRPIFAVEGNFIPMSGWIPTNGNLGSVNSIKGVIYVAERDRKTDILFGKCKILLNTNYTDNSGVHFVQVLQCESEK
jgi:hypothetical protein